MAHSLEQNLVLVFFLKHKLDHSSVFPSRVYGGDKTDNYSLETTTYWRRGNERERDEPGTSLAVQQLLRLLPSTAEGEGSILVGELRRQAVPSKKLFFFRKR